MEQMNKRGLKKEDFSMKKTGILAHILSLPGKYGSGDLGAGAKKMIDILSNNYIDYLQILGSGPTGYANSPYDALSTFALNPYFISLDILSEKGLLSQNELNLYPESNQSVIDYGFLYIHRYAFLRMAYEKFKKLDTNDSYRIKYKEFCKTQKHWLENYAQFMAFKELNGGKSWIDWDASFKRADSDLEEYHKFLQFEVFEQWSDFRNYANTKNVKLIGDIPLYVSFDSSDVYGNKEIFLLDDKGYPLRVAGVPPDSFTVDGQVWGNPLYNWDEHQKTGFTWWKERIEHLKNLVDTIKIDHFRGIESYFSIPFGEVTAHNGTWEQGPGHVFFNALKEVYSDEIEDLFLLEDLGFITEKVKKLKKDFKLKGMKIFQFIDFTNVETISESDFNVDVYDEYSVAYTGTHDNHVILGWFNSLSESEQKMVFQYLGINHYDELHSSIIAKLMKSNAAMVVVPLQDLLKLGAETRINTPGSSGSHNWSWRVTESQMEIVQNQEYLNK